ncbi:thiolase family protein [Brevibacterium spongiae]|uniref:Thiolase family protein n=1 Tax=Brevibacterium spongiae TaxID=2909672 RepID=A0ABY5SQ42_9MICO|nr:thiolase family protein [Brevibacterium spongiae]UVI36430.1 thiolase family protein [Brevibacterium spongiae]
MASHRANYDGVAVAVPVTVPYQRFSDRPVHWWIGKALKALVDQSGLAKEQIDGFSLASFTLAPDNPVGVAQHMGMSLRWVDGISLGGASGVVGLRRAARAVQAGDANVVACVAADVNQPGSFRDLVTTFSRFAQDGAYPYGGAGPNASFALLTDYYMRTYGATAEDFGKLAVSQRTNALSNPNALFRTPLTLQDYVEARPIADPIKLFDCVMPCSGADAFLVMREEIARDLDIGYTHLRGTIERHNSFEHDPVQFRGGWQMDSDELWGMADLGPDDMDFLQTYDDYPVISMLQFEDLGFCAKGEGPDFVRQNEFTIEGSFPHNTSGGQLSVGQAGAAGGTLGMVEALRQLTDMPAGAPVTEAKAGLVSGFGMINYDRGLCSAAAILSREGS